MFSLEDRVIDDWLEVEASIRLHRPDLVAIDNLTRHRIEQKLGDYCDRREQEAAYVPKSAILKESDIISRRAADLAKSLESYRAKGTVYSLLNEDYAPMGETISLKKILKILECIDLGEQDHGRFIEKFHERDPIPIRKRLGVELFLLGENAFGLSSKCTVPPDRGAGKPPTGELFPFVAAVMRQVGEDIKPTTLEQWSRDAQAWKREAELYEKTRKVERAELFAKIHGPDFVVPDEDIGLGTYIVDGDPLPFLARRGARRDWLILDEDDE